MSTWRQRRMTGTIEMFTLSSCRWWTILDYEIRGSPYILHVLLAGFASMSLIIASVSNWPSLIMEVLLTRAKFLQLSGYSTQTNCAFIFRTTKVFSCLHGVMAQLELVNHKFLIRLRYTSICATFKSHMEWNNAQHVSTRTTTILPAAAGTFHSLNIFDHVIYIWQTSHESDLK